MVLDKHRAKTKLTWALIGGEWSYSCSASYNAWNGPAVPNGLEAEWAQSWSGRSGQEREKKIDLTYVFPIGNV
jgi:hypothetical protein